MLRHKILFILMLPTIAMVASGCLFDPKKTDPVPDQQQYEAPTSPEAVLNNLRTSYERREFDEYAKLFDQERFVFKFAQVDVEGEDPLPPFWDWAEEEVSTRGLFENNLVESIDLEFTLSPLEDPDPNQIDDIPAGSKLIFLTSLTLVVTQDNPELGEQDIFIVDGDRHEFFFVEDDEELIDGESTWKIVEWRDKSLGAGNRMPLAEALP